MTIPKINIAILVLLSIFFCSCGKSEKQIAEERAVIEAVNALKKLSAATEVGINYQGYGTLLIEAKAKVNEASDKIQNEELKNNLLEAMQGYQDAQTFWTFKIKEIKPQVEQVDGNGNKSTFKFDNSARLMPEIVEKYKLKTKSSSESKLVNNQFIGVQNFYVDVDESMQSCWLWAGINLNKISQDIKNNN